jgi:hypothetical protein
VPQRYLVALAAKREREREREREGCQGSGLGWSASPPPLVVLSESWNLGPKNMDTLMFPAVQVTNNDIQLNCI